jgi:hypothetical protein
MVEYKYFIWGNKMYAMVNGECYFWNGDEWSKVN